MSHHSRALYFVLLVAALCTLMSPGASDPSFAGTLPNHKVIITALASSEKTPEMMTTKLSSAASAAIDGPVRIDQRDIDLIAKDVNLEPSQREITQGLYQAYTAQFAQRSKAHQDVMGSLRQEWRDAANREAVSRKFDEADRQWTQEQVRMKNDLLNSIQSILTQDQLKRWPMVQRDLRRRALLPDQPRFCAEDVDLIGLADKIKLDAGLRSAIDPTLSAWANEIDSLLLARQAAQDQWTTEVIEPMKAGHQPDAKAKQECDDRLNQRSRAIRDLTLNYANLVIATLASDGADASFRTAFDLAAYPIIYRPTPADRYLQSALNLKDLISEQKSALTNIRADCENQLLIINDHLAAIMRTQEDADPDEATAKRIAFTHPGGLAVDADGNVVIGNLRGVVSMSFTLPAASKSSKAGSGKPGVIVPGLNRAEPDSPQGRLEASKHALIQRTIDSAYAVLNPNQQARLPKPTAKEMVSPEEKMRRTMEKALSNAVITHNADGSTTFNVTVPDDHGN